MKNPNINPVNVCLKPDVNELFSVHIMSKGVPGRIVNIDTIITIKPAENIIMELL